MRKFQAIYRVTIYSNDATVIIGAHYEEDKDGKKVLVQEPARLTCQFNVTRDILSDSNKATINLYNLAPSTREKIFQDAMTLDPEKQKYVHLEAGYGNSLSTIFKGRILQAYSHRSGGSTDVITEIQAQALDIFDSTSSHTFAAGTTFKDAVMTLANDMPNVNLANMGQIEGSFKTSTTLEGKTLECLNEVTGGAAFVDGSNLNVLMNNEVLDVPVPVITDSSGLLGTPRRRDANLEIEMLFEPTLTVGQLLEIKSEVAPNFNGQFKVVGFTHNCMISGSQGGNRTTSVNLWIGPFLPSSDMNTTDEKISHFSSVKGVKVTELLTNTPSDARTTYEFIRKNKGKIPNTPITTHISWKDMLGHNNTDADRMKECTLEVCSNCWLTAQRLQARLLNKYYKGKKVEITSGWRSTRNNRAANGAAKSRHLYGLAIDFVIPGVPLKNIAQNVNRSGAWDYNILESSWIHVQLNPGNGKRRINDK